jgi:hypothetical protein
MSSDRVKEVLDVSAGGSGTRGGVSDGLLCACFGLGWGRVTMVGYLVDGRGQETAKEELCLNW